MIAESCKLIFLFTILSSTSCDDAWTGKWFPANATEAPSLKDEVVTHRDNWKGNWFPREPPKQEWKSSGNFETDRIMGVPNSECDDGETNLSNDFDPKHFDHSLRYMCLESTFKPSSDVEPIQTIYEVPKFYTPVHKCMNETIAYEQKIPVLGYHRPLWAAFGEYTYLPPQRWLHNIEHGAIVALYHPCANKNLIQHFKTIVRGCLYRHIITPYEHLSSERPFALAAWGISVEMSVINTQLTANFIRHFAKTGPEKTSRDGQYKVLLVEAAKIISDADDFKLCPNVKL